MLTKAQIKFVQSLAVKKHRRDAGLFVAEGTKIVGELLASPFQVAEVFGLAEWMADANIPATTQRTIVTAAELERLSGLTTPNRVVALVRIPQEAFDIAQFTGKLIVGLEDIQDPGNLGSLLRICDWFGVDAVLASQATADCFNPKVVQASMGSIARVRVQYLDDLPAILQRLQSSGKHVYATKLDGENLFKARLAPDAIVLFGNESQGLRDEFVVPGCHAISIPTFNANIARAESLNVAMAAGIVLSEFRRRTAPTK